MQYHFYMETQTADAKLVDGRGGAGVNLEITSATQNPKMMQQLISKTLNKPMATVEVYTLDWGSCSFCYFR